MRLRAPAESASECCEKLNTGFVTKKHRVFEMSEKSKESIIKVSETTAKQIRSICKKGGMDEKTFLADLIDAIYSISGKGASLSFDYETDKAESILKIIAK